MKKRLLSLILCLGMALTLLPAPAGAASAAVTDADGLKTAIAAGGTVTLGGDFTVSETLTVSGSVTLDLNGHTVTAAQGLSRLFQVETGASFLLQDSGAGGKLRATEPDPEESHPFTTDLVCIKGGEFWLQGGTLDAGAGDAVMIHYSATGVSFLMTGGALEGKAALYLRGQNNLAVVTGGSLRGSNNALYVDNASYVYLGGDVTTDGSLSNSTGALTVTGGTHSGALYTGISYQYADVTTALICGGAFHGVWQDDYGELMLYGGSFALDPDGTYSFKTNQTDKTLTDYVGAGAALDPNTADGAAEFSVTKPENCTPQIVGVFGADHGTVEADGIALDSATRLITNDGAEVSATADAGYISQVDTSKDGVILVTFAPEAPVATLSWTQGGESQSAQLTEREVRYGLTGDYLRDADPAAGASMTFLTDAVANLGFEGISPVTLTGGEGGPYTLSRDMADDGHGKTGEMLSVGDGTSVTVTNLTLDGTVPPEPPVNTNEPAFVTVYGSLTLGKGATVQNGQSVGSGSNKTKLRPALPPAAVDVKGGDLTLADGSKIVNNQGKYGGVYVSYGSVSLSGSVTVKGNQAVDLTGISSFDQLVNAPRTTANLVVCEPAQITGALTGSEIGVTLLDDYDKPTTGKVAAGTANYTLQDSDLAAFFSDRPGYFLALNSGENAIYLDAYAITTQPTADTPTVGVNQTKGAAYQWYPVSMINTAITGENVSQEHFKGTCDGYGKWTAGINGFGSPVYFSLPLKAGDKVVVTQPTANVVGDGQLYLADNETNVQLWYAFDGSFADDGVTASQDGDNTVVTYIIPQDGTYALCPGGTDCATVISVALAKVTLGEAVSGQTSATLAAPTAGDYLCKVTWSDGTVLSSDVVTVTPPPHIHAMSVGCEAEGEDQVTFDKALTVDGDGKLCVDGASLGNNALSTGHYYLAGDVNVTLPDWSYLYIGEDADVDLCLNGYTLNLDIVVNGQLRLCDCSADKTGAIVGSDSQDLIQVTGDFALYGGTVKNTSEGEYATAIATRFGGTAALYGGQVIAKHGNALRHDYTADALTLYAGVTLQGGADSTQVYLDDIVDFVGTDGYTASVITIAEPLTAPETPWRLSVFQAQVFTDSWATHMADKDFNDYFTCVDQGRFIEKTASGELAVADCAITAQPSAANGYTVTVNGAPSGYRWYKATVTTAEITDQNAEPYEYITGSIASASYENGKWTAAQSSEAPEAVYFTVPLQKGDKVTLTLDQLPAQGQLGLYAYGKGQLWCYFGGSREPDKGVSIDGSVITYVIPADGSYKLALDGLGDDQTAPTFSAQLTRVTAGEAVSGQTTAKLTAASQGTYLCRVTWPDGTTLDSDAVAYTPPHSHTWGKWTLQSDNQTLTRVCAGDAEHTESETLSCGLPNNPIVYDGAEKKPAPSLKATGDLGALTPGTDYTVSYKDNVNAGTGTVTITGMGNFDFTLEKTFTIQKADQIAPAGIFTITDVAYGQTLGAIAVAGNPSSLEYRLKPTDGGDPAWTTAAASNALPAGTYEFRYKATGNYNASPATIVQVRVLTSQAKALTIAGDIAHGTVTKRRDMVNPGDTVTLAVQPDEGYELETITVRYTEGGVEKTITPTVKADNPAQYTFTMPDADVTVTATFTAVTPPDQSDVKGEVEVKGDAPAVAVDEETLKDLAGEIQDGDTVTVKLTVEKQDSPTDKDELEAIISGKKDDVLYLDLSLLKQVNDAAPQPITDTEDKVLEIAVDYDFTGKKDVTVYRKHGENDAEKLTKLTVRPADGFTDGSFFADSAGGKVYVYASKFSTYAIGYTAQTTTPSRPSGGSSSGYQWPFVDVRRTDTWYQAVKYVYDNKLMEGTSATTFDPEGQLTRAMLATVLYRAAGSPKVEGAPEFEDTEAEVWYSDAIAWAAQTGVLRGYGNGKFGPDDPVSKEMLNMVMGRLRGQDPAWVGDPALAVPATRAEIAAMLMGLCKDKK